MFTGIVETTGEIRGREVDGDDLRLRLGSDVFEDVVPGASIAINGVCLTAERVENGTIDVFLAEETRDRTYLDVLEIGDRVNVERPLAVSDRLDGHLVQGHVDGTVSVRDRERIGEDWRYSFDLPAEFAPYVVEKGSVALDGISLTVAAVGEDQFDVAIIPETRTRTTIGEKEPGDPVHIEIDVVARYVEGLVTG